MHCINIFRPLQTISVKCEGDIVLEYSHISSSNLAVHNIEVFRMTLAMENRADIPHSVVYPPAATCVGPGAMWPKGDNTDQFRPRIVVIQHHAMGITHRVAVTAGVAYSDHVDSWSQVTHKILCAAAVLLSTCAGCNGYHKKPQFTCQHRIKSCL